ATSGVRPTAPSVRNATCFASARFMPRPAIRPNATFSQTGRLSNRAAPWNSMPNFFMTRSRSEADMPTTSSPSIRIEPASGWMMPRMHLIITDLPVPEPPITTSDLPLGTSRSTPSSTTLLPNRFFRPRTLIFRSASAILSSSAREEEFGEDVVQDQNHDHGRGDGIGRRLADALRAALGIEAVIAAHQRDREAEDRRLHQAGEDVLEGGTLGDVLQEVGFVEPQLVHADEIAAENADDVGDGDQRRHHGDAGPEPRRDQILE